MFAKLQLIKNFSPPDGNIFQLHLWSFILDKEVISKVNIVTDTAALQLLIVRRKC